MYGTVGGHGALIDSKDRVLAQIEVCGVVGAILILTVVVAVSIGLSKLTVNAKDGIAGAGWVDDDAAGVGNSLSRSQIDHSTDVVLIQGYALLVALDEVAHSLLRGVSANH